MATLNPFKIYENLETASNLNEYLPQFMAAVEGMVKGEEEKANNSLRRLGKLQRDIYKKDGGIYLQLLESLKNLHLEDFQSVTINGRAITLPSLNQSEACRSFCDVANEIASGAISGAVGGGITGALTGFGTFTLVSLFGTAGTGAAISGLSGAAATNAVLAWLGGGTLAAGGLGMAGGAALLTGLVALPALLITGVTIGAKSEKLYAQTMTKVEEAKQKKAEAKLVAEKFQQITKVADLSRKILKELSTLAQEILPQVQELTFEDIKNENGKSQRVLFKATEICDILNGYATNINRKGENEDEQRDILNGREKELMAMEERIIKALEA